MYKVNVTIETIVPYKQDRFSEEAQEIITDGRSTKGTTKDKREASWKLGIQR